MRLALAAVAAAIGIAALPAFATATIPAVDEYTFDYPDAKGEQRPGADTPQARPSDLSPEVQEALANSADGKVLATLATAAEIGAPDTPFAGEGKGSRTGSGDQTGSGDGNPSFVHAVATTIDDSPVPLLIMGLLAMVPIGLLMRARSRDDTTES